MLTTQQPFVSAFLFSREVSVTSVDLSDILEFTILTMHGSVVQLCSSELL